MKGDARFVLWSAIAAVLFVYAVGLIVGPIVFSLSMAAAYRPQPLPDTDIAEIPFGSWLPESAVLVDGYLLPGPRGESTSSTS